ncbi:MAG: response regulator transcription factor [Chloroflexota bacterium]|nr:response regulator transcription factor [Chloroflexota bacterium]
MIEAETRIRVLIVDDHVAVAESLHALLEREGSFELTEIAHDSNDAFRIVRERQPDVVLMDQALPGMSGAEATAHVIAACRKTAVIMFSGGMTDDELVTAVESGIRGYLSKGASVAEVISAIRRAAAGEILFGRDELTHLLRRARDRVKEQAERDRQKAGLTPREREVLGLMAQALEVPDISTRLGISAHTTRGYVQNILEKLGVHSKLAAVVRANALGVLDT